MIIHLCTKIHRPCMYTNDKGERKTFVKFPSDRAPSIRQRLSWYGDRTQPTLVMNTASGVPDLALVFNIYAVLVRSHELL